MKRSERYDFHDEGPRPPIGEARITNAFHIPSRRVVASEIKGKWVSYVYADGPDKGKHAGKVRRFVWNNQRRSRK